MPDSISPSRPVGPDAFNIQAQARRVAETHARRAGVEVREVEQMAELRAVSELFESVWGRGPEGAPLHSEVLRSLVHAGGVVTGAYTAGGDLVGAAALTIGAPAGSTYSLIAAAAPGRADAGIGQAVKLTQRAWALDRGHRTMVWTFDPLVGRNARFNLVKLGGEATGYFEAFYGRMGDALNGQDDADRLVITWELDSARVIAASEGTAVDPGSPRTDAQPRREGPDGRPMVVQDASGTWCRIPRDVVSLRNEDPAGASAWRLAVRDVLTPALRSGARPAHLSADGWYLLPEEKA